MFLGFSSGCLYKTHPRISQENFDIISNSGANAIELMCYSEVEIDQLLNEVSLDNLGKFEYISIHAPVFRNFPNLDIKRALEKIQAICNKFPIKNITVHPVGISDWKVFSGFSLPWGIENEDFMQNSCKSVHDLLEIFREINAGLVLDANHCFTNDASMEIVKEFAQAFKGKINQVHLSGFIKFHEPLFKTKQEIIINSIKDLNVPIIIESGCQEVEDIQKEYKYIKNNLK